MDGINTSGYAISAQRAQLNVRAQSGAEDPHPMRRRHQGHHGHHHQNHCHGAEQPQKRCGNEAAEQSLRYHRSENSVLKIRTQEGDVVALKIRVGESVKASSDSEVNDDSGTEVTETTLKARSSTKISFSVKGDLNDDEMAAIQAVFVQSAALADEFFAGDYAAAFASASELNIDADQLAKVSLRLRVRESLTYSGSGLPPVLFGSPANPQAEAVASETEADAKPVATESKPAPAAPTPAPAAVEPEVPVAAPAVTEAGTESETAAVPAESEPAGETPEAGTPASPAATSASAFWFSAVIEFVGKLIETFDVPAETVEPSEANQAQKSQLDLSLKLRMFSTMLVEISNTTIAGSEASSESLPALVPATIEALASEKDPGFDAVA